MQTSGSCPQFSDGVRKTVVGKTPPARRAAAPAMKPAKAATSTHRGGGFAKHARRGK